MREYPRGIYTHTYTHTHTHTHTHTTALQVYAQQLINGTEVAISVYADLIAQGWSSVPQFVMLLGLDNGPTTTVEALFEELDYIASAYIAKYGADLFVSYLGSCI